jgi:chemotaxis protein methyltransferase CheR
MREEVFRECIRQIEVLTGMTPPSSHCNSIRRELERRCSSLNLPEEEFLLLIRDDPAAGQALLNAATINETYFFREARQFRILRDEVLPLLFNQRKQVRLWSVSCSTGEEAVSLAVLARKEQKKKAGRDFTVFASDINTDVLERLKGGCFGMHSFRSDGSQFHDLVRDPSVSRSNGSGQIKMSEKILSTISVHPVNLLKDSFDFLAEPVDLIFFRNTLIYMALEKRPVLLERLAGMLSPGGFMYLASSEVPFVSLPELELLENDGVYYFRKRTVPAVSATAATVPGPRLDSCAPVRQEQKKPGEELQLLRYLSSSGTPEAGGSDPYAPVARNVRCLLDCTDRADFVQAQAVLDTLGEKWKGTPLFLYLEAWLRYLQGEKSDAAGLFRQTLSLRPDFWPARFYRALCIKAQEPAEARRELAVCLNQLEDEGNESLNLYRFLLEDFDTAYFIDMCRKGMEKIGESRRTALQGG